MDLNRKLVWNGNEIVFEDEPNVGVAGIGNNVPEEVAEEIVRRWNVIQDFKHDCDGEVK